MQQPLISILTPFKNTSKYLEECLDSIINQTYSNWELLIVDDASTDDSYSIVSAYSKKDPRIKLYKNDGSGIIEALRLAFQYSLGEFITRMDSDDIMTTNKLELMANSLRDSGKGHVALGLVSYFSKEGISEGYASYEQWLNKLTRLGSNYSEIYKECVIPSPCWMTYREDLINCEAFIPNRYPEDYDLAFRFYKYKLKCIPTKEMLHHWRDYPIRTSRTHEHYAQNHFIDLKLHYFLELNYDSSRPLTIWGAGLKGKTVAKSLAAKNIPFHWICDNPKKINKHIYNQQLKDFKYLEHLKNPQSIITVANNEAQKEIRDYLHKQNMETMIDYFFFC